MSDNPFDRDWTNPIDERVAERDERTEQLEYISEEFERIREVVGADDIKFHDKDTTVMFEGDCIVVEYIWDEDDE